MSVEVRVLDDPAKTCAELLSTAAASGRDIVLTGGSTPRRAYELAAQTAPASFAGARLWFSDERCVAPESELSNYALVKATLLDPLAHAGVTLTGCHRIAGERGPQQGALDYERELADGGDGAEAVRFECVLLGVGPDSHICSMFPGQASLRERTRLALGVPVAGHEPLVPRVTLTFAALERARRVVVLATGAGKADAVSACFAHDAAASAEHPASLLREHVPWITVLLDEDAASRL